MFDTLKSIFSFPNPVNEIAARLVAGMVVILSLAFILSGELWLLFLLFYGFLARVFTGPNLSPMGLLATRILVLNFREPSAASPWATQAFRSVGRASFLVTGVGVVLLRYSTSRKRRGWYIGSVCGP